ncbi:MAG: hypothetical protein R3293_04105 [Candidatus Promineifilaceae bacterium]|nr:hypothetical protein [Candidatus Promineifilaceae bacterium]
MPTLADRLEAARRQQFVGRSLELDLFRSALAASELPFAVLYLYGPGGIGKTSLLREYAYIAQHLGRRVCRLDGRSLEAGPEQFQQALADQLEQERQDSDAAVSGCDLLLIDTAELIAPLEDWLRHSFLPSLPDHTLTIFAGRNPPSIRWRSDPGWQSNMRLMPLKNLSHLESRTYLQRRSVPENEHRTVLDFTHGHPLALSLVADVFAQKPQAKFQPQAEPDVIRALLERFTTEVPSNHHRTALEACSQVRTLNEPLLAAMVQTDAAVQLLTWLRGLSFIEADPSGIYPHDLAREALSADLRWRNPDKQVALHDRARAYYMAQFKSGDARRQRKVLNDYVFLHRENPVIRPYFEWQSSGVVYTDHLLPDDRDQLLDMVRRYEGQQAAAIAAHWIEKQPQHVFVLRKTESRPQGFLLLVDLSRLSAADQEIDPGACAVSRFLTANAPLRQGETATLFRFWMDGDTYQDVSPTQSRIFLNMVQHYLTTPGLAYTFIPCAQPEFWTAMFAFADLHRVSEADFEVDGRHFGVYGHDWRAVPPLLWLERLAARELDLQGGVEESLPVQDVRVMDEESFKSAVRQAFNDYTDTLALQDNPLLDSRLVLERAGSSSTVMQRIEILRRLLQETTAFLQSHPRHHKWQRVIDQTYLHPASNQEQAAEQLDLPFSTYRRYLQSGLQQVSEILWRMEVGSGAL